MQRIRARAKNTVALSQALTDFGTTVILIFKNKWRIRLEDETSKKLFDKKIFNV